MPILHFICGKIASGKTNLAGKIAQESGAVIISEDLWLDRMYPNTQFTLQDYIRRSRRLRAALAPHVIELLRHGVSVVFDFGGNTPRDREWVRSIFDTAASDHLLHVLNVADDVCKGPPPRAERGAHRGNAVHHR